MLMLRNVTLAAALGFSMPALAADFAPPEGCQTFLTVQSRQCGVSNLYRCDMAKDGSFWEAFYSAEGLQSLVTYSPSYQWLDALYFWDGSREEFVAPAEDPIDIDALLADGVDTFRFTLHRTGPGEDRAITIVGADVLTGTTKQIDGVDLSVVRTELQILSDEGIVEYHSRGLQYFDHENRVFFLGPEEIYDEGGNAEAVDGSPVDFIQPGEPGFASTLPLYECDQQKAGYSPAPAAPAPGQKEITHDQI